VVAGAPQEELHPAPQGDVVVDDDDVELGCLGEGHVSKRFGETSPVPSAFAGEALSYGSRTILPSFPPAANLS
jgi:hypothetical protein